MFIIVSFHYHTVAALVIFIIICLFCYLIDPIMILSCCRYTDSDFSSCIVFHFPGITPIRTSCRHRCITLVCCHDIVEFIRDICSFTIKHLLHRDSYYMTICMNWYLYAQEKEHSQQYDPYFF